MVINTLQYDARYTQRHINTLQYDARYTQRHKAKCLIARTSSPINSVFSMSWQGNFLACLQCRNIIQFGKWDNEWTRALMVVGLLLNTSRVWTICLLLLLPSSSSSLSSSSSSTVFSFTCDKVFDLWDLIYLKVTSLGKTFNCSRHFHDGDI